MKKLKLGKIPAWISGGGVLFLSSACLFAVGFSAWTFGGLVNGNAGLDVNADGKLIDINSYITYEQASIFDFCQDGIVADDTIVAKGDIVIPFKIVLNSASDKISNHLPDNATSFMLATTYTNKVTNLPNLLNQYLDQNGISFSVSTSQNIVNYSQTADRPNVQTNEHKTTFTVTTGLDGYALYFNLKYSFTFPTGADYKTNFYDKLLSGYRFLFNLKAEVEL